MHPVKAMLPHTQVQFKMSKEQWLLKVCFYVHETAPLKLKEPCQGEVHIFGENGAEIKTPQSSFLKLGTPKERS